MKIAVIPDMAMIVVNLINKNGHEYLSATNISMKDLKEMEENEKGNKMDYNKPPFNMKGYSMSNSLKYTSSEVPPGVKGQLSLYHNIIKTAQAAIIINKPEKKPEKKLYNPLNSLILFGCISCSKTHTITTHNLRNKKIPRLELTKPTTQEELIQFIKDTDNFLKNLDKIPENTVINKTKKTHPQNKS